MVFWLNSEWSRSSTNRFFDVKFYILWSDGSKNLEDYMIILIIHERDIQERVASKNAQTLISNGWFRHVCSLELVCRFFAKGCNT